MVWFVFPRGLLRRHEEPKAAHDGDDAKTHRSPCQVGRGDGAGSRPCQTIVTKQRHGATGRSPAFQIAHRPLQRSGRRRLFEQAVRVNITIISNQLCKDFFLTQIACDGNTRSRFA